LVPSADSRENPADWVDGYKNYCSSARIDCQI
jgi:hypothetical protein